MDAEWWWITTWPSVHASPYFSYTSFYASDYYLVQVHVTRTQWSQTIQKPQNVKQRKFNSGPAWDQRRKGPFSPWLRLARSIETCQLQQSHAAVARGTAVHPQPPIQVSNWNSNSTVLPLVSTTESLFPPPIVYKRTLNSFSFFLEMVFGDSSLPSRSASLPIKVSIPCSNSSSLNLLAGHAVSRTSLDSETKSLRAMQRDRWLRT